MKLVAIKPELVPDIWPLLDNGMDRLMKDSLLISEQDILEYCASGEWLLFCVFDKGEPVVSIVCTLRLGVKRVFDVFFCWGAQVDAWIDDVYAGVARIARELNCDVVVFNGRRGWSRMAKDFGFKVNSMIYVKELT